MLLKHRLSKTFSANHTAIIAKLPLMWSQMQFIWGVSSLWLYFVSQPVESHAPAAPVKLMMKSWTLFMNYRKQLNLESDQVTSSLW